MVALSTGEVFFWFSNFSSLFTNEIVNVLCWEISERTNNSPAIIFGYQMNGKPETNKNTSKVLANGFQCNSDSNTSPI